MAAPSGFCEAEIILPLPEFSPSPPSTIQYFIGATPITSPIPVSDSSTTASIQADIDNDPVYMASGTTIAVVAVTGAVTAIIQKESATQITDLARGVSTIGAMITEDSSEFTCNIPPTPKKKRRRVGAPIVKEYIYVAFPIGMAPIEPVNFMGMDYINPILVATSTIIRFDHQNNEKVLMMPYINYDPYYTNYNIYRYTINRNNQSARNLVGLGAVDYSKK